MRITEFTRKCPSCNTDLYYATLKGKKVADKLNRVCKRCSNIGENNPSFGKPCPDYVKEILRKHNTGKFVSNETRVKHREYFLKNNPMTGLTGPLCPNFGKTHSEETKEKLSLLKKGVPLSQKQRNNIGLARIGKSHSDETKRKMRISKIQHIIEKNGNVAPRFNTDACKYFQNLENERKWNGLYATKNGEFFVKSLGYFVDYYEPNLNIVVEYDEPKHYNIDNTLKKRDLVRMNEIKEYLHCKFLRYNEKLKELKEY
jgi:hypothetical protein